MKISVVLCSYNGAEYLGQQLESISIQSLQPFELLIRDDGSQDSSVKIAQEFAQSAPFPVYVLKNPHQLGITENFCQGIMQAKGDVIAFSDQDDIWYPEKLQKMALALEEKEVKLVFHNAKLRGLAGDHWSRVGFIPSGKVLSLQEARRAVTINFVAGMCCLVNRDFALATLPASPSGIYDEWIVGMAALIGKVGVVNECLAEYRIHENQNVGMANSLIERCHRALAYSRKENQKRYHFYQDLIDRSFRFDVSPEKRRYLDSLLQFSRDRTELSDSKWKRLRQIAARVGSYRAHGYSWLTAFKDWLAHD